MNGLACEWIPIEPETVSCRIKLGERRQVKAGSFPELFFKAISRFPGLDANLLDDLLVEVVEKLLLGQCLGLGDFRLEFLLELIEFKDNLFWRTALLIDRFSKSIPDWMAPSTSSEAPNTPSKSLNFWSRSW
jgi:hypothetical protein